MPVIRIVAPASYPTPDNVDIRLQQVIRQLSAGTGIESRHLSTTFQSLPFGHYQVGGDANANLQFLVECLIPSFHNIEGQAVILNTLAQAILNAFELNKDQLFIELQLAESGRVWDNGEILQWDK